MNSIDSVREFFGWCTVFNFVLLGLAALVVSTCRRAVSGFHARLFDLTEEQLIPLYFRYLANYKIAVLVFCFVPYLALLVMG